MPALRLRVSTLRSTDDLRSAGQGPSGPGLALLGPFAESPVGLQFGRPTPLWAPPSLLVASPSDAANGTDSIGRMAAPFRVITDAANGADTLAHSEMFARGATDAANGTDSIGRLAGLFRPLTDAANGTDAVGTDSVGKHNRTITDLGRGVDSIIHLERFARAITDAAHGTDTVSWSYPRSITDAAGGRDIITAVVLTLAVPVGRPSAAWTTAALSDNWRLRVQATVWSSPSPGPGVQLSTTPLDISGGSITVDRNNAIRRSGSLTVADPIGEGWAPHTLADLVAPNGNELHLTATALIPTGVGTFTESDPVSLGWFAITDAVMNDTLSDLTMTVTFFDRAWAIAERKFGPGGFNLPPNYSLHQMIAAIIGNQYPGIPLNVQSAAAQSPISSFAEGEDPWQRTNDAISQTTLGYELFLDRDGKLTGYPTPDPRLASPIWSFTEGATNTALRVQRTLTRTGIANDVVRSSSATKGTPLRAEVKDELPSSPTWVGSQFGHIYDFGTSALITDEATAQAVAANDFTKFLGMTDVLDIDCVPLPFLDVDDVISVSRARLGLSNALYVIDHITVPFRFDGVQNITARRVVTR